MSRASKSGTRGAKGAPHASRWNRLRFSLFAPIYDPFAAFARERRQAVEMLGLTAGESVLVIGAGTGRDLLHLPQDVQITAVDVAQPMLRRTRDRAAALGLKVSTCLMDAHRLRYERGTFDAAILSLVISVVDDPGGVLQEVARVLRPGGRAIIFDKFVADGARPPAWRRLLNLPLRFLFTDITLQLGPLLLGTGLQLEREERAWRGGTYSLILLRKQRDAR